MDHEKSTVLQSPWVPVQNVGEHPVLLGLAVALFLAGVAADLWILAAWLRRRDPASRAGYLCIGAKPWGLAEVGLIMATLCTLLLIGSLFLSWLEHAGALRGEAFRNAQLFTSAIVFDGLGLLAILLLLRVERIGLEEAFGLGLKSLVSALVRAVFFLLAILPPVWLAAGFSQELCEHLQWPIEPQDTAQLFLRSNSIVTRAGIAVMAIIAAPLFEEFLFRGLAYPALKRKLGFGAAVALTSLVFAAIHFHALSFLPLAVLSVGLTLAYEVTGNLGVPILMHSLFNLMTIVVMVMVPS